MIRFFAERIPVLARAGSRFVFAVFLLFLAFDGCPLFGDAGAATASHDAVLPGKRQPLFEIRELYAVGHFGNSYEVMGNKEMRELLAEAKAWGFNRYCDWFDTDDCRDPFEPGHSYGLGDVLWETKKVRFGDAKNLDFACVQLVTPNHVYVSQCLPELLAVRGKRIIGQLICPSNPEARAIILKNYRNLFADMAKSGVQLDAVTACPYDWGGCACDKCKPWILTFAKLAKEIHDVALEYHPRAKMNILGWWWAEEEHRLFADWVDRHAPGWVDLMFLHLPYGETKVADVPLPKGCKRCAFIHIAYAEEASPRDSYGHLGPVIAADRMQKTVFDLKEQGVVGFSAYSEGVFDEVNKFILGGLATGEYQTSDEALAAYARRYFSVDADTAKLWAAWLKTWGKPFDVNLPQSAATLQMLLKKTPQGGWRLRQWELKQQLFALNKEIGTGTAWTPERLAAVDRFWDAQEQIQRGLWGLPPQRHGLGRRYTPLPWFKSWAKFKGLDARQFGKEQ